MDDQYKKYLSIYHRDDSKEDVDEFMKRFTSYLGCVKSVGEKNLSVRELNRTLKRDDLEDLCYHELKAIREFANRTTFKYESFYSNLPKELNYLNH